MSAPDTGARALGRGDGIANTGSRTRTVEIRGLCYRGEVVVADAVLPEQGEPLPPDLDFRLVFFTQPRRIGKGRLKDRRIAMAAPARPPDPSRQHLAAELRAIRETQARYTAGPSALEAPMAEREDQLMAQIARRDAAAYSNGRIYTLDGGFIDAGELFAGEDLDVWADRLASQILTRNCVRSPFERDELPGMVTEDVLAALHREMSRPETTEGRALKSYGPALGLAARAGESGAAAIDLVHAYVGARGGRVPADALIRTQCSSPSVPADLAALTLQAFAVTRRGEIGLTSGHGVVTRNGEPLAGDRIPWDLVPEVKFQEGMGRYFLSVSDSSEASTNSATPYLREILGEQPVGALDATGWIDVAERLEELGQRSATAEGVARRLAREVGAPPDTGVAAVIGDLQALSSASDHVGLAELARDRFGSPSALSAAIELASGLEALGPQIDSIIEHRRYLEAMRFSRHQSSLRVERDAALARIDVSQLTAQPSLWPVIEEGAARLTENYRAAYAAHHSDYHRRASDLGFRLKAVMPQVSTIERLNGIPELGEPVAFDVLEEYEYALGSVKSCSNPKQPDLGESPSCGECGLALTDEVHDGEPVIHEINAGMAVQGRRLAALAAGRVLGQADKPGLAKFLELVQAGDSATIANVLDDDVVEFLRDFARTAPRANG